MKCVKRGSILLMFSLLFFCMLTGHVANAKDISDSEAMYVEDEKTGTRKFVGKPDFESDISNIEDRGNQEENEYKLDRAITNRLGANKTDPKMEDVILIGTEQELKDISNNLDGNYVLTADIVLSGDEWIAISEIFTGMLDGNGHTISNLVSSKGNGLFFDIGKDAVVQNLTITGTVTTTGKDAALLANTSKGMVLNCRTKGSVKQESGTMAVSLAGMINYNSGYMENCINEAEVAETFGNLETIYNYCFLGGLVSGNYGTMTGCENNAVVMANCMYAGGVVGVNSGNGLIENCVNKEKLLLFMIQRVQQRLLVEL